MQGVSGDVEINEFIYVISELDREMLEYLSKKKKRGDG